MKYAIALDIGGTSIKYTLVNQNGDILYESSETTQSKENPRPLSDTIKSVVRKMTDYAEAVAVGINSAAYFFIVGALTLFSLVVMPVATSAALRFASD